MDYHWLWYIGYVETWAYKTMVAVVEVEVEMKVVVFVLQVIMNLVLYLVVGQIHMMLDRYHYHFEMVLKDVVDH
jgi:hypothetical protein